jgi:uncharacterized protein YdeI (BOF family)
MTDMRRSIALTLLLLLSTPLAAQVPIAAARQQATGNVSVIGCVTVVPGTFSSSSGDEGFAIEDQTGGIWISVEKRPPLKMNQCVRVTGSLGLSNGKLQIVPSSIGPEPRPLIRTGQVGAATLGSIITVEGTITKSQTDDQYGWKLWINDGSGDAQIFLNKGTKIDPHAAYLQVGRRIRVTGFGNVYQDDTMTDPAYEVDPRSRRDIVPLR